MTHISLSQDGFQHEDFWEVGKTYLLLPPPFVPSWILLAGFQWQHLWPFLSLVSDITIPYGYGHPTVVVVQSLSHVWFFATPWTAARQPSLSSIFFQSLLKFKSIEFMMLSNHLIFCCPLLLLPSIFPSIRVFSNESSPYRVSKLIGASASASVLLMNIQGWFPLGLTGLISLQSKRLSRVFFSTTVQKHQFLSTQPALWPPLYI